MSAVFTRGNGASQVTIPESEARPSAGVLLYLAVIPRCRQGTVYRVSLAVVSDTQSIKYSLHQMFTQLSEFVPGGVGRFEGRRISRYRRVIGADTGTFAR